VQKIKTIGDAFMAAAGLLEKTPDNPVRHCVQCGLEMIAALKDSPTKWNIRVGISSGPVVAGVIGRRKFIFDLWGDAVNTASRMESHGVPGRIQVTGETEALLRGRYRLEERGVIPVKGKGSMRTWFLLGRKGEPA